MTPTPTHPGRTAGTGSRLHVRCDDCGQQVPRWTTDPSPTTGAPICVDCTAARRGSH